MLKAIVSVVCVQITGPHRILKEKGEKKKYASTLKLAWGVFTAGSTVFTVNVY